MKKLWSVKYCVGSEKTSSEAGLKPTPFDPKSEALNTWPHGCFKNDWTKIRAQLFKTNEVVS